MNLQRKFHFFSKKNAFFIYFVANILFLSQFPFIHSDESWLSGLTREIFSLGQGVEAVEASAVREHNEMSSGSGKALLGDDEGPESDLGSESEDISLTATEPFFDLLPRFPHFIKMLFHALQAPFIYLFGYGPFAVRLLSLVAGCLALLFFYRAVGAALAFPGRATGGIEHAQEEETTQGIGLAQRGTVSGSSSPDDTKHVAPGPGATSLINKTSWGPSISFVIVALLALDIQFIYAAHFGRQEIVLVASLTAALWVYFRGEIHGDIISGRNYGKVRNKNRGKLCGKIRGQNKTEGGGTSQTERFGCIARWTGFLHRIASDGKGHRAAAMIIGLSIGIHPNSFLISLPIGAFLLVDLVIARSWTEFRRAVRRGLEYMAILAAWAALYVGLSYLLEPQFLYHYRSFGDQVGVAEPLYIKAFRFPDFYKKLFYRISGTYYTPAIKLQFYLFGAALAAAPITALLGRGRQTETTPQNRPGQSGSTLTMQQNHQNIGTPQQPGTGKLILQLLAALLLLNAGTLVLGKYSQPSIILHFPLYYLLIALELAVARQLLQPHATGAVRPQNPIVRTIAVAVPAALLLITAANSAYNIGQELHLLPPKPRKYYETYAEYGRKLHKFVPADATVLANLNAEYHFGRGQLLDYRNLDYLDESGLSFSDYIEKNSIEYIVYPQEMDFIYRQRPVWNILYGNVASYYGAMQQFLAEKCRPVGSFESPIYGMRITRYMGRDPWQVQVYKVIR